MPLPHEMIETYDFYATPRAPQNAPTVYFNDYAEFVAGREPGVHYDFYVVRSDNAWMFERLCVSNGTLEKWFEFYNDLELADAVAALYLVEYQYVQYDNMTPSEIKSHIEQAVHIDNIDEFVNEYLARWIDDDMIIKNIDTDEYLKDLLESGAVTRYRYDGATFYIVWA